MLAFFFLLNYVPLILKMQSVFSLQKIDTFSFIYDKNIFVNKNIIKINLI